MPPPGPLDAGGISSAFRLHPLRYRDDIAKLQRMETIHNPIKDFVTRGGLSELISSAQAGLEELRCAGNPVPEITLRLENAIDAAAGACEEEAEAEHLRPRTLEVTEHTGKTITVVARTQATPIPRKSGGRFVDARVTCHCGGEVNLHGAVGPTEPLPVTWSGRACGACDRTYTFAWGSR